MQTEIESIGDLWTYGARIYIRCAWGRRDGLKQIRECGERDELDVKQLLWTHGAPFPIARLALRLKCPRCGSRVVSVNFSIPTTTMAARALKSRKES